MPPNPAGAAALADALQTEREFRSSVGVISVMADKDVAGILTALEPAFDLVVVTHNGSPRAMDTETLASLAEETFGPERVVTAPNPARRHRGGDGVGGGVGNDGSSDGFSGAGMVITGSVVTAGAARTLFGKDPA